MNIELKKKMYFKKPRWFALCKELPGASGVGDGRTAAEAVACFFLRNMQSFRSNNYGCVLDTLYINDKPYCYAAGDHR
jgi:hypothetical protein